MAVAGAAMSIPAGAVLAAAPIAMGGWTVDGAGNITAAACGSCSSTSATPVTDAGFLQRNITIGSKTFIQTIIAEAGDTTATTDTFGSWTGGNGFADENFVEIGGTGGLADKQEVQETVGTEVFTSTAGLNTGSFFVAESLANVSSETITNTSILLNQGVSDSAQEFTTTFGYTEGETTAGTDTDVFAITDIRATVNDSANTFASNFAYRNKAFEGGLLNQTGATDLAYLKLDANTTLGDPEIAQEFHLKERSGNGAVTGVGTALATAGSATGSTLGFATGDHIVNLQVGQKVTGGGVFGLNDFVDETASAEMGSDSQANANVPFTVVTDGNGGDPFGTF